MLLSVPVLTISYETQMVKYSPLPINSTQRRYQKIHEDVLNTW